jgi:WD40 repeat protein|eukprot:g7573.t1
MQFSKSISEEKASGARRAGKAKGGDTLCVWEGDFPIYAAAWSARGGYDRFAVGSCYNQEENFVRILRRGAQGGAQRSKTGRGKKNRGRRANSSGSDGFEECCDPIFHSYPPSALAWRPDDVGKDLFVSSGQLGITIYSLCENTGNSESPMVCNIEYKRESEAPVTNLDWNRANPSQLIACRGDAKCVMYDLNAGAEKAVLSPRKGWQVPGFENNFVKIFDVKFCNNKRGLFATAHEDGSINLYDERSGKESLTQLLAPVPSGATEEYFIYEKNEPVIKLAFGPDFLLAALKNNSSAPIIMDIRKPNFPITLECHENERYTGTIAAMKWCPGSSGYGGKVLATAGGKGNVLFWNGDIYDPPKNNNCNEFDGTQRTRCNRPCVSDKCESHQVYDNFFNRRPIITPVQPWEHQMQRTVTNILFDPSGNDRIAGTVDGDVLLFNPRDRE